MENAPAGRILSPLCRAVGHMVLLWKFVDEADNDTTRSMMGGPLPVPRFSGDRVSSSGAMR